MSLIKARQIALAGARSVHAATAFNPADDVAAAQARPFSEVPRPNKIKILRGFMPGGEFYDSSFLDFAITMRKRYGDLFIIPGFFGRPDFLAALNAKDIETVFRNEGIWPQREGLDSLVYFREKVRPEVFGELKGLIAAQNEGWGKFRSAVNPVFMQPRGLKMYYEPLSNINNEFIERIKEIRDPHTLEVPADFDQEISRLVFESIALIAFNRQMGIIRKNRDNPDALRLFKSSRLIFQLSFKLDVQPSLWKFVSTPTFRKLMRILNESVDISQRLIEEARLEEERRLRSGDKSVNNSMMQRLINIDPKVAVVMGLDLLLAGVDASSTFLGALLLCLSKNQDKQHKLRAELLRVMPTKETILDEESMKDMPYLRAVIKEALRYYPNGVGTFRNCATDVTLSGYNIPKGTQVLLGANALMKEEAYFPQADKFLPERWLRDPETNKKAGVTPFTYLPFGFGPRMCIGKRVVDLEMETSLAKLIRNFHVEFNYDASKPFKSLFLMEPAIPFRFKFTDVDN
ncbi:probable cytochrome P450 12d1 distal, mitochondrial [Drosophila novamexicana]|uniref:probable cytochrome P450 12d1 distal, mitochondrial n=1 Tax=Drosophila novamexicana TaxID=47314 RepID=UPI0011E5BB00|nr:probable cytochrome P450 12d1 distal, mitochondrial [Drosophila novamexicana]